MNEAYAQMLSQRFLDWCSRVVNSDDHVIIDTETTSLEGEVVDLAIIDMKGNALYSRLCKPLGAISPEAEAVHHITNAMVADAPTLVEQWYEICSIVGGRRVIAYNKKFDEARLVQSLRAYGIRRCEQCRWHFECAMVLYANFWQEPSRKGYNDFQWQNLSAACHQQGIALNPVAMHRALADCQATLALIRKVAMTGVDSPRYSDIKKS